MLVQPALIAHLLCRPVSIADSTGYCQLITSLVQGWRIVLRFRAAGFGKGAPESAKIFFRSRSCALLAALHPADHVNSRRARAPAWDQQSRPGKANRKSVV